MASRDERCGKELAVEEEDKFPAGLRVLAVDDDAVCLRVLEVLLRMCKYEPTLVTNAKTALKILREGGEDQFDLVISDVHMPDMDGFELLEIIGLEMDLPVIMLSVNGEKGTVYKGIAHGACDYMVKPPNIKGIRNIWQHVVRKNQCVVHHSSSDSDDADQRVVQPVTAAEGGQRDIKSKQLSKKKKQRDGGGFDKIKESRRVQTTRKNPRVSWAGMLHNIFVEAVNRLGIDKAVPKTILQMMNVQNLSRESVASHLQKYKLHLKRVKDEPEKYTNSLGGSSKVQSSYPCHMDMNHSCHDHQHPPSGVCLCAAHNVYAPPSILGPHGLSIQPRSGGSMLMHDVSWQPDTSMRHASGPPIGSSADHTMLDAFPTSHPGKAYTSVLREKLLEAITVVPPSHPGNSSFEEMPNGEPLEHVNQFPVQALEFCGPFSGLMNAAPSIVGSQLPNLVGNSTDPWQNVGPSNFSGLVDGAPLVLHMNQLPSFEASPGQMSMFQNELHNQMTGIFSNSATSMGVVSEQMTPLFDAASNMAPVERTNDSFSPMTQMIVNGGSTSSPSPNLQTGSSVTLPVQTVKGGTINSTMPDIQASSMAPPTQGLNDGDASGILPVQDSPADQQPSDDQITYISDSFLQQIFAGMVNQDFNPDDDFFGEEY